MRRHVYWLALLLVGFTSCKEGGNASSTAFEPVGAAVDIDKVISDRGNLLADACSIISMDDVAAALGVDRQTLYTTDSTPRDANPTHSSCFFKWDDAAISNAGILLQVQRNPAESEFPNYIPVYIESKRTRGEQGMNSENYLFEKLEGLGDDGSYNSELSKYYWRLGDKVYFAISFNSAHTTKQQYDAARQIGAIMTKNYIAGK